MLHVALLLAAALPAATVSPARVPAKGRPAALLAVEKAGMVRLAAGGAGGTACTVVDELRGPFATSGQPGAQDCAIDLLLDAGRYRVLLASGEKAKGEVALAATSFRADPAPPLLLEAGRPVEASLPDGAQASWWIRLDRRGPLTVRVAGRTAGAVHLWRAGAWREPLEPVRLQPEPGAGQPVHEWWLQGVLEAGDYLVTAYGTAPLRWTRGAETDLVTVQAGFAAPPERTARLVLPASGAAAFATDFAQQATAVLTTSAPVSARVRLSLHPLDDASGTRMPYEEASCQVEPRAPVPECAAMSHAGGRHVVLVRGVPGTTVELRWAPFTGQTLLVDGEYRSPAQRIPVAALPGDTLLGLHDVPADPDAAPLACALERQPEQGGPRELVAFDAPQVGPGQPLRRAFNYDREATLWFQVTQTGDYAISAQRASCELYKVDVDVERVTEGPPGKACRVDKLLAPGVYELRLRGGKVGLEQATVASRATPGGAGPSPARTGCALRARIVPGWRYTLLASRAGAVAARGVFVRPLPLDLARPLPIEVPAGARVSVPVSASGLLRVTVPGGALAGCHLERGGPGEWKDGACWLRASGPDALVLQAKPEAPLLAWAMKAPPAIPPAPLRPHDAAPLALPALAEARPARVDLAPGERKAFVFDVEAPGLYDVGTEGLLATACALRTPALARVAEDARGGRGRNCQVSAWLRPGRYLVSVEAQAPSRGRASVVLGRRSPRDLPRLAADGEAFFRAEAGELVRARLAVSEPGRHELAAAALGAEPRCRLEDAEGWPLAPVPGPCRTTLDLPAGDVVLAQLPLTVESMRRVAIEKVKPAVVLEGEAAHPLALWTRRAARLGKDGQDVFTFELPAELDVGVLLTNGMQGRVYREGEADALEIVPPMDAPSTDDGPTASAADEGESESEAEAPEAEPEYEGDGEVVETHEGEGEGEGEGETEVAEAPAPRAPPPPAFAVPSGPEGHLLHLPAGRYRLVTEHSRGDAAIAYDVQLSTDRLAPGVARAIHVPTRLPLRVPVDGTLRLRTRGDSDVRCRVVDGRGRLVAETAEVGEDWNCGLAEPIAAGDYTLVVESETHLPGAARIEVSQPAPTDVGPLADGKRHAIGAGVLSAALPAVSDALLDLALDGPVACAIDGPDGKVLFRASPPVPCRALVAPAGRALRLRAWTVDRPAEATARLVTRKLQDFDGGKLAASAAGRARVERAGRWRTGEGVRCLAGEGPGVLGPCGPEVSLEAGPALFAGEREVKVELEEAVAKLEKPADRAVVLDGRRFVQRQRSGKKAVHLAVVQVPAGERTVPACALEGGVFSAGPAACFAAAGPADEAVLRLSADAPVEARLWRAAVPLPDGKKLAAGIARLEVPAGGARYTLPDGPVRAELILPPGAWAVLLVRGAAQDLCPPETDLARCVLSSAQGGEVVVLAPGEKRLQATVLPLPAPPAARALAGVVESVEPAPGTRAFRVAPAPAPRALAIEGAARCALALDGGGRSTGCEAAIPAGEGALVTVEHGAGPLRATVGAPGDRLAAFGRALPTSGARLAPGAALRLEGESVAVALRADGPSVLHVRATSGVCALAGGAVSGLGGGCALDLLAEKGERILAVRGFAGAPLQGAVTVVADGAEPLAEGVGPEGWIGPGEARFFRFEVRTRGKVGLGLQEAAEVLECSVLDGAGARPLGLGCQQLLELDAGAYLLAVRAPPGAPPMRFRPVLLGLAGAETTVPEDALRELFQRIGVAP